MPALHEISVTKFPLTQRSPPPPACLLRVTICCADSAPARAPSTLARWRIEPFVAAGRFSRDTMCCVRNTMNKTAIFEEIFKYGCLVLYMLDAHRTHINGARAGALLAPQLVTRRRGAGGDVQLLQSLQFRDYSLKHTIAPQEHALTYRPAPAGFLGARLCQKYRNIVAKMV